MPKKKMRRGSPRAYQVVKQPGSKNQKWARADNPWFDPTFTGVKITTPYDNMPKPLDTGFWDKVAPKLQQTQAPNEYDLALETVRNMKTHQIHYGNTSVGELAAKSTGTNVFKEGWSAFNWTMDKLFRPAYGIENAISHDIKDKKKEGGFNLSDLTGAVDVIAHPEKIGKIAAGDLGDFWKGFTKKEEISGPKIASQLGIKNKWAKTIVGTGIDFGADPSTYIPGGALLRLLRGGATAAKGAKGAKVVETVAKEAEKAAAPSGDRKFIELSDEAHDALWPGAKKAKMPTEVKPAGQESLFPEEFPVHHGPEKPPVHQVPKWAKEFNKGQQSMVSLKGQPKLFGAEATAKATAAAAVARAAKKHLEGAIPAYPGTVTAARVIKPGQTLFERVEGAWKGRGRDFEIAMQRLMGKTMKEATKEEKQVAAKKLFEKVSTLPNVKLSEKALKEWRATLKKHGIDDEMIADLEKEFAGKSVSNTTVKAALRAKIAARNLMAASDEAGAVSASRPAAEIIKDAADGDIFAKLNLDNAGRPDVSMAGAANTTGGGNIPIRKIEELTDTERNIAHAAMDKHTGEMGPKAQADLVKNIKEEANRIIREAKAAGVKAPKEAWNIRRSATNAQAIARAAMERLSRDGIHPKHPDGTDWNILDISDMIGGRQGFEKMFGIKLPKGDVGYLHTLSKYATLTAKYLDGEGAIPAEVRGKPGFINIVRQMKNAGEAATSVKEAKAMQPILEDMSQAARVVAGKGGSDADMAEAITKRMSAGEKALKAQGVSEAGIKTFKAAAAAMKFPETPEGKVFLNTAESIAKGTIHGEEAASGARRAMDDLTTELNGGRTETDILEEQVHDVTSRAVEHGITSRFAAFFNPRWGSKQVHAAMLKNISFRQTELNMFRSMLTHISQHYTPQQIKEAQQLLRTGQNWESNELAVAMKEMYDNTLRAAGLGEHVVEGQSLALRGGLTMKEMNRELGRQGAKFRFAKYAYDHLNRKVDLSEGTRWLESAQLWEADDVLSHLSHIRAAAEQASVTRSFMHDVGKLFGSTVKTAEHTHRLTGPGTESIADHFFSKDIAEQMSNALRKLEELRQPHSNGRKLFEEAMGAYKTVFTVMNPRHHVVNNIGNVFLNWMAGVNNPNRYVKAADISRYANSVVKDLASITDTMGPGAYARSMDRDVNAFKIILESRKVAGKSTKMNVQQVFLAAKEYGIVIGAHGAEDIAAEGAMGSKTWLSSVPGLNKAEKWGRFVSEQTENHTRYAMFIDQLMKHGGEINDAALRKAAQEVRKWHPDGTDLTAGERKYMRLLFPFYSWTRKAVPLMIEGIVYNPKKLLAIPKGQQALAMSMGMDPGSFADPFPVDQAFPNWIRESGMGPVFAPGMKIPGLPRFKGYGIPTPQLLPPTAIGEMFSGTPKTQTKGILSQINPVLRMPVEEMRGRQFFGDRPISDQSQYFAQNIPGAAQYTQIAGRDPFDLSNSKFGEPFGAGYYAQKETGSSFNPTKFANWLTGAGLKDTGPLERTAPKPERKRAEAIRRRQKKQPNA